MRLVIDKAKCVEHKMTFKEVLVALVAKEGVNITEMLENLVNRGILKKTANSYSLNPEFSKEIDSIIRKSGGLADYTKFMTLADKMKECFPEGRHPLGNHSFYRSGRVEVAKALANFTEIFGKYTDDEILEATKRYIASFNGNYEKCAILKNFIYVDKDVIGQSKKCTIEGSRLAEFLENKEDSTQLAADDWLVDLRV